MPPKPQSQATRGRGRGGSGAGTAAVRRSRRDFPTPKRHRGQSDDDEYESATELDPEIVADSLLVCLAKREDLMETFIMKLFKLPKLQDKIVTQVLKLLKTTPTENVVTKTVDAVSHDLNNTIEKLSTNVEKLTDELSKSRNQCDELEQYSRRNNIIISGIPESTTEDVETQALRFMNDYSDESIRYHDIDRAHRITRTSTSATNTRPRDIIVKFTSHKSKKAILSREPMKKLKSDNDDKTVGERVFVREDLTRARNALLYKARVLKRAGHIKDTFSRDGRIAIKLFTDKLVFITNDEEFVKFCSDHKIKYVDPKAKDKKQTRSSSVVTPNQPMVIDMDNGSSQTGMDPNAEEFVPTQTPMARGMGANSQDPTSPSLLDTSAR